MRFNETDEEKIYLSKKEFLNEKYKGLAAIHGNCYLETSKNESGKVNWVWGNSELEISDGSRAISLSFDVDSDYEESLKRLETIIEIVKTLKEKFIEMKEDYDKLEEEAKLNRSEITNVSL